MLPPDLKIPKLAFVLLTSIVSSQACTNKQSSAPKSEESADTLLDAEGLLSKLTDLGSLPKELRTIEAMTSGKTWRYVYDKRETKLATYLDEKSPGFAAFQSNSVALNGTPALIFRLLPVVMPELFSDEKFEIATGYYKKDAKDILPYGLAFTKAPAAADGRPSPLLVNLTCGACHTGRVSEDGKAMKQLVGAPSTVADVNGFRNVLSRAVANPAYTYENFKAALMAKADGELYGPDRIMEERIDKAIFFGTDRSPAFGAAILEQFRDGLLKRVAYAGKTVGGYTYKNDLRLLANTPGHIDFSAAVALALTPPAEVMANPAASLQKYYPAAPGIADIMSVWRQDERSLAQWDGNLKAKLTRNLGAELGVAGDPKAVNFPNALLTTQFVENLPSPAFPFPIDLVKAAKGEKIYQQACASCHESEQFMPVAAIGTEPGRAKGTTKDLGLLLLAALKVSCSDIWEPDCNLPDSEIFIPRHENPGYLSLPMTGIWARAPYLHNGSVPTISHLLVPESRPAVFQLNNFTYDQTRMGFQWDLSLPRTAGGQTAHVVSYDTAIPGYSNAGHADVQVFNGGIDFGKHPEKLEALLEYLKTK